MNSIFNGFSSTAGYICKGNKVESSPVTICKSSKSIKDFKMANKTVEYLKKQHRAKSL